MIPDVTGRTLAQVIREHVDVARSQLWTDEHAGYRTIGKAFNSHSTVNHSAGEYKRDGATSNAVEGYFSQLKRSLDGTQHHVSTEHLPRYLAEFDFRYSHCKETDADRMRRVVDNAGGRRLTYKPLTNGE